ncbi:hypothetical protein COCSUDRAFT_34068 [Coccomyxa subellipsoidea C-169]|uniref:Uncharacterized protein n=1 Tax=Coccomyxa subellipsoidea (strain C-169) TaxID=574566 RepID=I0YP75_COCSC|nr:hypothetical protein COCSUDRAFT_34068 [Coccomyxa subellipsoidea C-169]EIE20194.1 hypothetical protein COCSUDRAFT_34068 [Coccomyxa subellipsoidea C-169]|eukprot:XP_005644738.1 hypothetical protein COCSUDRAFT_34068 [Coccomyxa subellipsoidea C-169]
MADLRPYTMRTCAQVVSALYKSTVSKCLVCSCSCFVGFAPSQLTSNCSDKAADLRSLSVSCRALLAFCAVFQVLHE